MKSFRILILSLIGAIVLAAGALYFGAPLFGWLIMIAIFLIYLKTSWDVFHKIRATESERKLSAEYAKVYEAGETPNVSEKSEGILDGRIRFLRELSQKQVSVSVQDMPFLKSVWANREDVSASSNSGVVVLLGLMGTFFGLMLSINAAGSAIDTNVTSESTLGIIQSIFSSMKGIFGSSLCGLFAALILNAIHAIYESEKEDLTADLDRFTLLYLIPAVARPKDETAAEIRRLSESLQSSDKTRAEEFKQLLDQAKNSEAARLEAFEQKLSQMEEALSGQILKSGSSTLNDLAAAQKVALDGMRESVQSLVEKFAEAQKSAAESLAETGKASSAELRDSLAQVTSGLSDEMRKLAESVRSIETGVIDGLEKEISALSSNIAETVAKHLEQQMENSGDKWNEFMESLKNSSESVADAERKGLEMLGSVAETIASRANESTVGLSGTITGEIENLSQKVQTSFTELAKSSENLVASQQTLISGIENRVVRENESATVLGENLSEAAKLMHVNQSELAANLEMFGKGVEAVLAKLTGDLPERENEQNFIEQLNSALASFQERSGEILLENAVKTQEILLEILNQVQKTSAASKAE